MTARSLYLCPSDRAARAFQASLAASSIAPSDCVDIERFCRELWQRGQLFGLIDDSRELVDASASDALWKHVVSEEGNLTAAEIARIAALASDAWALSHRYDFPMASLKSLVNGNDNLALFARCALRMQSLLKQRRGITPPELASTLIPMLASTRSLLPARIVLTPAFAANATHTRLLNAMTQLGVDVELWQPSENREPTVTALRYADEKQEMQAAIAWAATTVSAANMRLGHIAIVVPELSSKRAIWLAALREQLNPDQWWLNPETDRDQFNLSVGLPLAEYPYIACLAIVLRAVHSEVETEVMAQALSHPRWGRSSAALKRIEQRQWQLLERGIDQCTLADWLEALPQAVLSCVALQEKHDARAPRSMRAASLTDAVRALTEHAMIAQSDLFQLDEAWTEAIKSWKQLDRWLPPVTWRQAISEISQSASERTFQPKAGPARIQVMGLLESAGVPFAAAWIVGFTDRVLPEPFKPNPMLSLAWQMAHHVGLGSRDEVRRRANALWANWGALTGSLHVSYAADAEPGAQHASALAAALPFEDCTATQVPAAPHPHRTPCSIHDEALPTQHVADAASPPLASSDVERQAHCPRKAAASFLRLREWPEHVVGISPRARGTLVHEVMAAVGEARMRGILDGVGEPSIDALRQVADDAFTRAASIESLKRTRIPVAVWDIERARLLPLIEQVLALDAARDGFRVVNVEEDVTALLFNAAFKLRVDRVDDFAAAVAEDEQFGVVLDYKTGAVARADWFAENSSGRLAAPQLPLYLFALHAVMPPDAPRIGALGYIVISDDDVKFIGLGADASLATKKPSKEEPEWFDLTMEWKDQIAALVDEIQHGVADVAPLKGRTTCRNCRVASFCREPWSLSGSGAAEPDDADAVDAGSAT